MFWDTSDTLLTIDGGTGNVSTTVSYENGSSTLVIDVLSDFTNASSVTISGLSYISSSTVNAATTTRDLKWTGQGQAPPFVRDTRTVTIRGRLALAEHSSGQEADKFAASSTNANAEMFAFELAPRDESASTTLVVDLSGITEILTGELQEPQIFYDDNANGMVDEGFEGPRFGPGSVNISGDTGTITFSTLTNIISAASSRYILTATTTNLLAGDTITFSLSTSSVNASGTISKAALVLNSSTTVSNAVHTVNAASRNQRSFRWQDDDGANVNSNTAMVASGTAVTGIRIGQRLTLRMQADNDGAGDGGIAYKLQYQRNGTSSTWSDVASGNEIRPSEGLAGANGASITSAVAATNARTFTNGVWTEGTAVSNSQTLPNNNYTELGFMLETGNATTSASSTYYFRVVKTDDSVIGTYTEFPSLTTVAPASNTIQYSKVATSSIPTGTSSLTYFFDDADYTNVDADDGVRSTSTATANHPVFLFRTKVATSSHPIKVTWNGQYSAASSTFLEIYRKGGTNAWVIMNSTSGPAVDTDFTLTGSAATSVSEYYDADGSNFWVYARVRQATTTSNFRTDQIKFEFIPITDSTADQTFEVNDAATAISQLRVKAASTTPVVTAANDIRITIPNSLNMKWATSTTVATLGGSASGNVSTTVTYPDEKTLLINVETNFAANDDLNVSGLSFTNFTSASASTSLQAFYGGSTSTTPEAVDAKIKQVRGQYALVAHTAGQQANKLDFVANSTSSEFLSFQITPTGESATSTQIVINLTDIQGILTVDVTSTQLFMDLDNDGVVDAGEPQVASTGTPSISGSNGTITFTGSFAVTSTRNLILYATLSDIQPGEGINFEVSPSSFSATGQTSEIALVGSGTSQNARHNKPSNRGGGGGAFGGAPPWVANVGGGSGGGGGQEGTPPGGGNVGGGSGGGGGEAP